MEGQRLTERDVREAALDALSAAVARFSAAYGLRGKFPPLAEALLWAVALDDHLKREPSYSTARDGHPGGSVVLGFRYARNFAIHDLVAATEEGGTYLEFPLFSGDDGDLFATHYRWLPEEDLPAAGSRRTRNAAYYAAYLGGRDVGDTLAEAVAWFESVRSVALPE